MDGNSYAKGNIHAIQLTMQAVWQIFAILVSYLMDSDCPDLSELIRTVVNPDLPLKPKSPFLAWKSMDSQSWNLC